MKWRWWCEVFPNWKPGEKERWEELSEKGKFHYVLVRGALVYGGWGTLAMTAMMYFSSEFDRPLMELLLTNFAFWIAGGAVYGELTWRATSESYEEQFGQSSPRH